MGDDGEDVPVEDADDVVERVVTVEFFVVGWVRGLDVGVIGWVGWVVAPGVVGADGFDGDDCGWRFFTVSAVEYAQEFEGAGGGCLVALGFLGGDTGGTAGGGVVDAGASQKAFTIDEFNQVGGPSVWLWWRGICC